MSDLPVRAVLPEVLGALAERGVAVLEAPTGAGKTTLTPLALLDASWNRGRVLVLEPRRLAARAAARRMSQLVGEPLGATVGYTTRDAREVSPDTRVEVVTEGILTRRLQRDPSLEGVSAVLFDEFHERSIHADLGLALTLDVRDALRPDLRIVVMSATLEADRVAALLEAPRVRSEGRLHPVEVRYRPRPRRTAPIEPDVVDAVLDALHEIDAGDVLTFLPGAGEIRRAARRLRDRVGPDVVVAPLFGALPPDEQDRALDPAPPGTRKVVLATDIAQTSLTIEGVRVVVDAGLDRQPRLDPRTGMSRLRTVPVSRADAEQRRGRAGRTAAGVCYRLWSRAEHHALEAHPTPQIAQVDLTGFALEVAAWGVDDPSELRLLDPPPGRHLRTAVDLLRDLGALTDAGRITEHGRRLAELPVHPRLGHALLRARDLDLGALGCDLAALLSDRDPLIAARERPSSDLAARVRVLRGGDPPPGARLRGGTLHRARQQAQRLRRDLGVDRADVPLERTGLVLAFAYPDRVARRRGGQRGAFTLSNGRGARLPDGDVLAGEPFLVVADVDRGAEEARIHLAAAIDRDGIELALGDRLTWQEVVGWDRGSRDVVAERRRLLDRLVLDAQPLTDPPREAVTAALLDGVRSEGLGLLPWDRAALAWRARVMFLRRTFGADAWPDLSDRALLARLEAWLGPFLPGARRRADLDDVPLLDALRAQLGPAQHAALEELAPGTLRVPSGSRPRLDYESRDRPVLEVRVQELFGATATPRVAGGRVPVLLRLLSPARRPVQVTDDLAGFWERAYPQVRAELRGRYPKHHWPEDPRTAQPTSGVRPR